MSFRATFNSSFMQSAVDLTRATSELAERQKQVSSGKRLNSPSDDPSAASSSVREHSELAAIDRYSDATDTANARLSVADSVLSDMIQQLTAAKTTILAGQSSNVTDSQRDALANDLASIRDALFADYTTKFNGTYLFSGQAATVAPYQKLADGTVTAYAGTTTPVAVDVDRQINVQISFDGNAIAKGSAAADIFATLNSAIAAVRSGDGAGMLAAQDAVVAAFDRTTAAQSQNGAGLKAIEAQQGRLTDLRLAGEARTNALENANMAEAIAKMTQADTAYKAALGAIGTTGRITLMDYL